jgi:hypothetical protein
MADLISRLQALTEPSREIDAEIALANGWYIGKTVNEGCWFSPDGEIHDREPPRFTGSLDAALTLVPQTSVWRLEQTAFVMGFTFEIWMQEAGTAGHGPTPAIALLIAIMKTMEATP